MERVPAGTIRHTLKHEDGYEENVSANNLLAVMNRLCGDANGNRTPIYYVLPQGFYKRVTSYLKDTLGVSLANLPKDREGGIRNCISQAVVYKWNGYQVLAYTPSNNTCWSLNVGDTHELIRKQEAFELLGPNKGFDPIVPFWTPYGYAPPRLLLQWAEEGFNIARDAIQKIAALPSPEKLQLLEAWEARGFRDSRQLMLESGIATNEELLLLPEPTAPLYLPAGTTIEGEIVD